MKIYLTNVILLLCSFSSFSQTDIIEMRSRNRSLAKYERISISTNDHVPSNFGMAPDPIVRTALLDSVKALSDSTAIVYTSEYCTRGPMYPERFELVMFDSLGRQLNEPRKVKVKPNYGDRWRAGADTVTNHPIFTKRHSLDSVKEVLDREYYFNGSSDETIFIGFDNKKEIRNADAVQPVKHKRKEKKNDFGWELLFMIVTPIAFLLGMNQLNLIVPSSND